MQKLGFDLVDVERNYHHFNGMNVDGYTYRLVLNDSYYF